MVGWTWVAVGGGGRWWALVGVGGGGRVRKSGMSIGTKVARA